MKKFIEKLIGRLGEQQAEAENEMHRLRSGDYTLPCSYDITDIKEIASESFKESIQIVNELAEEHKGSWIPCSERLPEEPFGCLVTVMDCEPMTQTDFENILPYHVGYDGETWNDADGNVIPFEVLAWQPLPEPYKEEAEQALKQIGE